MPVRQIFNSSMTHFSPPNADSAPAIEHCVTLIPCHTLEDFPSYLEETAARSLLAAWTAPWHPRLIAMIGRLPSWARVDSVPEPLSNHAIFLASGCESKLTSGFHTAREAAENCHVIRGADRREFLNHCAMLCPGANLGVDTEIEGGNADASSGGDVRLVSPQDFFALGYAWLQVQLMTRRLRYTSNLDEIYFAGRVVEAAKGWVEGNGNVAVAALHEAFDALAEERDHYFSTDPHLVDLTLLAPSTLGPRLESALELANRPHAPAMNFLIDCDLAKVVGQSTEPAAKRLIELIDNETVGVAGGGVASNQPIHHQTAASARQVVADGRTQTDQHLGRGCNVFARVAGPTPGDLATAIASQQYIGAIPIDFAAGEGWASESKLCWNSKAGALDVLVAKPIDGSQSSSFLSLAIRLGQAIDGGEIATALIVHWPGAESDAYLDLRKAASWGLALGRFWKVDEFFRDGQRPYHHYRGHADDGAAQWLPSAVAAKERSPLTAAGHAYRERVNDEAAQAISALADLVKPLPSSAAQTPASYSPVAHSRSMPQSIATLDQNPRSMEPSDEENEDAAEAFCERLSACPVKSVSGKSVSGKSGGGNPAAQGCIVINPHSTATRIALRMDRSPAPNEFVFGSSVGVDGKYDVTVDVPAHGFVALQPSPTPPRKKWFGGKRRIAKDAMLINEFMQVEVSTKSGGIMGVYSGAGRGNRYSLRLVHVNDDAPEENRVTEMLSRSIRIVRSDEYLGVIEADGTLVNGSGQALADFTVRYSLSRGSRWLWAEAEIKPSSTLALGENPWRSYFAFRSAVASEVATFYTPLRDKLHRTDNKRFDSPAGLLIDESPKQTLLFADGRPAHRRRGDRYIDSLLVVRDESLKQFRFAVGFDVPAPIDALRSLIAPPSVVTCDATSQVPASGWLVHCSTPDVAICDLKTESTSPLVVSFLAVATRGESRKAKIRFCRDLAGAQRETFADDVPRSPSSLEELGAEGDSAQGVIGLAGFEPLDFKGDRIELDLSGHEVVRIRVELVVK
jgi:alpha-mannosidase